jgi:predicted RNA-binding Zn-ribbon protein involved in translation (DUF1610 family)
MQHVRAIVAVCPSCGPVQVPPEEMTVRPQPGARSYVTLRCPACGRELWGSVPTAAALRLKEAGFPVEEGLFSPEVLERPGGSPLTEEDAERFARFLERDDLVLALRRFMETGEY